MDRLIIKLKMSAGDGRLFSITAKNWNACITVPPMLGLRQEVRILPRPQQLIGIPTTAD